MIRASCSSSKLTATSPKPTLAKTLYPTASTTGSTTSGVSNGSLSSASIAKTAALTFKIVGLYEVPDNALGNYAVLVVKLNQHQYGSVGVASDGA